MVEQRSYTRKVFFTLQQKKYNFLKEEEKNAFMLQNQIWITELAFFVDILKYMNEIIKKLQGKNMEHVLW